MSRTSFATTRKCLTRKELFMGFHFDWPKMTETASAGASGAVLTWFLNRRAQKSRDKLDARTQDQKNIDQLMGRVCTLEGQVMDNTEKIEELRTIKMQLEITVVGLTKEIAKLEILKAQYESRDIMSCAQIQALETRLVAKEEQLLIAQAKLTKMVNSLAEKNAEKTRKEM